MCDNGGKGVAILKDGGMGIGGVVMRWEIGLGGWWVDGYYVAWQLRHV